MKINVYGIPTCDSCRKARRWLDAQGHAHTWVDVRATPPSAARVKRWVAAVGSKPLRNTSGASYRALPDDKKTWSDGRWVEAFTADPMLLKRPVLEVDGEAVACGFKEERWGETLGG